MSDEKNKQLFLSLIYSFQMQTMMQLGKLSNPMSGKIERELDGAQVTIDMLDMLKEKTKGNIADDELKFLIQAIADLKLNYVEERDKEKKELKSEDTKPPVVDEKKPDEQKKPDEEKIPPVEKPPVEEKKPSVEKPPEEKIPPVEKPSVEEKKPSVEKPPEEKE